MSPTVHCSIQIPYITCDMGLDNPLRTTPWFPAGHHPVNLMTTDPVWLLNRPAATDVVDSQSQVIGIPSYLGTTGGPPATRYYFIEISRVGRISHEHCPDPFLCLQSVASAACATVIFSAFTCRCASAGAGMRHFCSA